LRPADAGVVDAGCPILRPDPPAYLGVLAPGAAHLPPSGPAHGVSAPAEQARAFGVRPNVRPDVGRGRSDNVSGSCGKEVIRVSSSELQVSRRVPEHQLVPESL